MKHFSTLGLALICALLFIGCAPEDGADTELVDTMATEDQTASDRMDSRDIRADVEASNTRFERFIANSQFDSLATLYSSDGQVLAPGAPIASGEAIPSVFEQMVQMGVTGVDLQTIEVEAGDEFAYEVGAYTLEGPNGMEVDNGKYIVIWTMEDGTWKIHRDMFNSDVAPVGDSAPAETTPADTTMG